MIAFLAVLVALPQLPYFLCIKNLKKWSGFIPSNIYGKQCKGKGVVEVVSATGAVSP